LIGKPPFETSDTKTTYKRILRVSYSFPSSVPISDEAKDLISKILVLDPSKRLTLDEIMQHPFMRNHPNKAISTNQLNDSGSLLKKNLGITATSNADMKSPSEQVLCNSVLNETYL